MIPEGLKALVLTEGKQWRCPNRLLPRLSKAAGKGSLAHSAACEKQNLTVRQRAPCGQRVPAVDEPLT